MKGFVFDLDNTLFDRYGTITEIMRQDQERLMSYINPAYDIEHAIGHVVHTEALNIINGWESVYSRLLEECFFNRSNTPTYRQFYDYVMYKFNNVAVAFPFTVKLLKDIKRSGRKLGIITNGSSDLQNRKIDMLGFRELFDCILVAGAYSKQMCGREDDFEYWKPNRAIFDEMSKQLSIAAQDLYYVGDNTNNDVIGSAQAGYVPIWIISKSPWIYDNSQMPINRFYSIEGIRSLL